MGGYVYYDEVTKIWLNIEVSVLKMDNWNLSEQKWILE